MSQSENTFIGEFSYTIDAKGRINIPAKFRQALSEENEETFILTRGLDPCVWIYPLIEWKKIEADLRNLSSLSALHRTVVRNVTRYASFTQYDKQGRIPVSPSLIEYSHLNKNILIIGMVNKIEVWNPDTLQEVDSQTRAIDFQKYEELADKVRL
jgi:MraZ protein